MTTEIKLSKKDFTSDQEVRWCPGCGDYAILSAAQQVFPELGVPREKFVIVSGIGCSSRFPYYMKTYGFHTIHGRAPSVATGVKLANPELSVWIVTGDGDGLSIGGNHIIHLFRRNVDVNVMLFDNRIYGLTKGQYSPTSETGKRTKSTPFGSVDRPFNPCALALGAGATFVARSVDIYADHLRQTLKTAHAHRGTSFIQIFQNCNIFNDGAFEQIREKGLREEHLLLLEHGKPLVFGKDLDRGIRLSGCNRPEIVELGNGVGESDLMVHDEAAPIGYAAMLSEMQPPSWPMPVGVIRRIDAPCFDAAVHRQIADVTADRGNGDLRAAIHSGNTWKVS
ncbi:MAG TPA: 2-oxoacid:ferredoxin oxidoreductase subunit beta [Candidatus Polarisedimenticolaceae bacterium]|nr:2-oxoacid:ferredoxin oxidoreductase subunit beta [Candidatus Polarisedimenticolaceae bacterium]